MQIHSTVARPAGDQNGLGKEDSTQAVAKMDGPSGNLWRKIFPSFDSYVAAEDNQERCSHQFAFVNCITALTLVSVFSGNVVFGVLILSTYLINLLTQRGIAKTKKTR